MSELTPITRIEEYLDAIVDGGTPPLEDITRVETFLDSIYNNTPCALTPVTRIEMYLGKISGQDIELPEPVTRVELYLASIAGMDVVLPDEPVTRIEMYLAEWAEGSNIPWETLSGAIVSFIAPKSHALKEVLVDIEPQQDLHGYDAPWPAGGGENMIPYPYVGSETTIGNITLTPQNDGSIVISGAANNSTKYFTLYGGLNADVPDWIEDGETYCISGYEASKYFVQVIYYGSPNFAKFNGSFVAPDRSGYTGFSIVLGVYAYASFTTPLTVYPMLNKGNTAQPFSPYSNICPISGWTGANVQRTGKNLLNPSTVESGAISGVNGLPYADNRRVYTDFIKINGAEYAVSNSANMQVIPFYYDKNKKILSNGSWTNCPVSFTPSSSAMFVRLVFRLSTDAQISPSDLTDGQAELGSTASAYEAYQGNTYAIDWTDEAGTVYGGTLTVNEDGSGEIAVTWGSTILDGSTGLSNGQTSISTRAFVTITGKKYGGENIKSNQFYVDGFNADFVGKIVGRSASSGVELYLPASVPNTNTGVRDWLANNNTQIVFELATPITYTLTAQQVISALQGYNAMWADTGDITVTFRGTPVTEPDEQPLQALNLLLGGAYRNNQTQDDVSDEEALDILLGGADR